MFVYWLWFPWWFVISGKSLCLLCYILNKTAIDNKIDWIIHQLFFIVLVFRIKLSHLVNCFYCIFLISDQFKLYSLLCSNLLSFLIDMSLKIELKLLQACQMSFIACLAVELLKLLSTCSCGFKLLNYIILNKSFKN